MMYIYGSLGHSHTVLMGILAHILYLLCTRSSLDLMDILPHISGYYCLCRDWQGHMNLYIFLWLGLHIDLM